MISPESVTDRFLRYVKIDTQSDPESPTIPSTAKQKNLAKVLVEELKAIGIKDAELDEFGYIYATIPATTSKKSACALLLLAHGYLTRLLRCQCKSADT